MRVSAVSRRKVLLLVVASVGTVAWGLYSVHDALAGTSPFPIGVSMKCYETHDKPLDVPVKLFDAFHPPLSDDGGPIPEGGEAVTVKGPHLICAPLIAECFPKTEQCVFFGQDGESLAARPLTTGLKCYKITPAGPPVNQTIAVFDEFNPLDPEELKVGPAKFLCEPALSPAFGPPPVP